MRDKVPTTDDEVAAVFDEYPDELLRSILQGLYKTKRLLGNSVVDAYVATLTAHIEAGSK